MWYLAIVLAWVWVREWVLKCVYALNLFLFYKISSIYVYKNDLNDDDEEEDEEEEDDEEEKETDDDTDTDVDTDTAANVSFY